MGPLPGNWLAARTADLTPDLQVSLSWGSIAESFHSLGSLSVSCFQVILGLQGPRFPLTCMSKAVLTAPLERSTCPYQRSLNYLIKSQYSLLACRIYISCRWSQNWRPQSNFGNCLVQFECLHSKHSNLTGQLAHGFGPPVHTTSITRRRIMWLFWSFCTYILIEGVRKLFITSLILHKFSCSEVLITCLCK